MALQLESVNIFNDREQVLPPSLLYEIEQFSMDNAIVTGQVKGQPQHHCCDRCLKAHALKYASDMQLDSHIITWIESLLPGEAGHDGYYLDKEVLIPL